MRPLQQLLCARGHAVPVDGIFGRQTESAVEAFQQDARPRRRRRRRPEHVVAARSSQVRHGSTGDAVRGVQEVMKFHDQSGGEGPPIHVDGIFGPQTERVRPRLPERGRHRDGRHRRPDHVARARQRHALGVVAGVSVTHSHDRGAEELALTRGPARLVAQARLEMVVEHA